VQLLQQKWAAGVGVGVGVDAGVGVGVGLKTVAGVAILVVVAVVAAAAVVLAPGIAQAPACVPCGVPALQHASGAVHAATSRVLQQRRARWLGRRLLECRT